MLEEEPGARARSEGPLHPLQPLSPYALSWALLIILHFWSCQSGTLKGVTFYLVLLTAPHTTWGRHWAHSGQA